MKYYILLLSALFIVPTMAAAQNIDQEFDNIDTDGDGYITSQELNRAQKGTLDRQNESILSVLDENGDKVVELDEYVHFYTKLSQEKSPKELEGNFRALDTDGNGKLDIRELKDFRTETLDDTDNAFIEALDINKDGKISRKEFNQFIESLQVMFGGMEQ